jgi:hypothetical protein
VAFAHPQVILGRCVSYQLPAFGSPDFVRSNGTKNIDAGGADGFACLLAHVKPQILALRAQLQSLFCPDPVILVFLPP